MQPSSTQSQLTSRVSRSLCGLLPLVVAAAAACGGTTGLENIVVSSDSTADPAPDPPPPESDGATDTDGLDAALDDAALYDRSIPQRPPPVDTGAPATPDSATTSAGGDASNKPDALADAGPATTISILAEQSPDCFALETDGATAGCAATNGCLDPALQGGVCETVPGVVARGNGISEVNLCLQTLRDIFASQCAAGGSETPCLCGDASAMECLAGTATPTGPIYPDYVEDFGANINAISANFTLPAYGAGQANSIVQCLQIWNCQGCFGKAVSDAGADGAGP